MTPRPPKPLPRLLAAAALALACQTASALTCTINSALPVLFGNYYPGSGNVGDAQSSMKINCAASGSGVQIALLRITLGAGLGGGGIAARSLQRGTARLPYGLYRDSARTDDWGDGTAGTSIQYAIGFTGSSNTYQVYARIPASQNVPTGLYTDTVVLRVDY